MKIKRQESADCSYSIQSLGYKNGEWEKEGQKGGWEECGRSQMLVRDHISLSDLWRDLLSKGVTCLCFRMAEQIGREPGREPGGKKGPQKTLAAPKRGGAEQPLGRVGIREGQEKILYLTGQDVMLSALTYFLSK